MAPETTVLSPESPHWPNSLRGDGVELFPRLWASGDVARLHQPLLGVFCATRCPGDVILQAYETARTLRDAGIPVIGGFHTPMEQECLDLLLRGTQLVVWCPARGLPNPRRLPRPRGDALAEGRLLILSPFSAQQKRMTAELAELRNELVSQVAHRLLFLHAPPGSKTEALRHRALAQGKEVLSVAQALDLRSGRGPPLFP